MKYLIVGLGNPGNEYDGTRHNIGFAVLDALAEAQNVDFAHKKKGYIAEVRYRGHPLYLLKPTTFMNESGRSIQYWMAKHKTTLASLLVVVDDVSLPFGVLRLRKKGSAGGHNGLADIESTLKTNAYARLRFGIAQHYPKGRQTDYVLSAFDPSEQKTLPACIKRATEAIQCVCFRGIETAMNTYNGSAS